MVPSTRRLAAAFAFLTVGSAGCSRPAPEPLKASASVAIPVPAGCPADMREIVGGTFHPVDAARLATIARFCIDATEVTVDAYAKCVEDKACSEPDAFEGASFPKAACNWKAPERGKHPINCVAFTQADAFCRAQGKRLPTTDEWTWVARGAGQNTQYPWGDDPPRKELLNACGSECPKYMESVHNDAAVAMGLTTMYDGDDGFGATAPVGSFPKGATATGVQDLAGNVAEWTSSSSNEAEQPARGGCWFDDVPALVRTEASHALPIDRRVVDVGFRCAKNL